MGRYLWEQFWLTLCGWIPTILGVAIRAVIYRLILKMNGLAAIESGVRLRFAGNIKLGKGSYLDQGVYLHACPAGVEIGENTYVMHGSVLHVYNFRDRPHAGIRIGKRAIVGEMSVIRGQGGVTIGDDVLIAPKVQILAIKEVDPDLVVVIFAQPNDVPALRHLFRNELIADARSLEGPQAPRTAQALMREVQARRAAATARRAAPTSQTTPGR